MNYCVAIGTVVNPSVPTPLGGDFIEAIRKAATIGYDAVELHIPSVSYIDIPTIKRCCEANQVKVATLGTGTILSHFGLSLIDTDPVRQKTLVRMVEDYIDLASKLECKVTIGSIKGTIKDVTQKKVAVERLGVVMEELSEYAGRRHVTLLLEATNRYENAVLNRGQEVCDLIEKYNLKHVELLLDSFHANIEEPDIRHCIKPLMSHLGHIHFADNTRWYPGAGCFDFSPFVKQIKNNNYRGVLSVECLPLPNGDEAAKKALEFLHNNFS